MSVLNYFYFYLKSHDIVSYSFIIIIQFLLLKFYLKNTKIKIKTKMFKNLLKLQIHFKSSLTTSTALINLQRHFSGIFLIIPGLSYYSFIQ